MREILFKAKRIDNGEWAEGFLVKRDAIDEWYILSDIYEQVTMGHRYLRSDFNTYAFRIYPYTACQYTELTDSNGMKVFEGDILKFTDKFNDYEWIGRVEFGNPNAGYTWGWQLVYLSGEKPNIDTLCWFDMEESGAYSEVIGNIHDKEEDHGKQ